VSEGLNTHDVKIVYGKQKRERITRLPASYLRWMVNENAPMADYARAEIDRRGHKLPDVELSGHAIDSASLRVRKIWHETRSKNEGLHSWLMRVTLEALENGERLDSGKIKYLGMKLVIEQGEEFPILKTVMK